MEKLNSIKDRKGHHWSRDGPFAFGNTVGKTKWKGGSAGIGFRCLWAKMWCS